VRSQLGGKEARDRRREDRQRSSQVGFLSSRGAGRHGKAKALSILAAKPGIIAQTLHCSYNRFVAKLRFEWDARKAAANRRKHGISFEEAKTVFYDERALLIEDPDDEGEEDRFVLLGISTAIRTLVVCHCYRESDSLIRIISARKASRTERRDYEQRWK
jgi:uncharacterized protein